MDSKSKRGFASMEPDVQREIASKGGKSAHAQGVAHEFESNDKAREAGRKGGKSVSRNREHMAKIGAMGGRAKKKAREKSDK